MSAPRIVASTCFACGHHVAVPFFYGHKQPLATIAWPKSQREAQSMKRLDVDFVRCVECGHIYNASFRYADVPYSEKPNLMFNQGAAWSDFIRSQQRAMVERLPAKPTIIEIGHGDGSFIAALATLKPDATCLGFDPHGATQGDARVTLFPKLFEPEEHLLEHKPHLLITRHVLEHLTHPLAFLQQLNFFAGLYGLECHAYFEVPCVDRVIETGRTVDLYYEHSSQFTTGSFAAMLAKAGVEIIRQGHGYDGEVIYAFVKLAGRESQYHIAHQAEQFSAQTEQGHVTIRGQLTQLIAQKKRIAIWGGTGKSAAFMNFYGLDAVNYPLVVDSDPAKVGTHVPGQGQVIQFRDVLKHHPVDVIIIPPQWRARDIVCEMRAQRIEAATVLIEHEGRLIDFLRDEHPYRKPEVNP